MGKRGAHRHVAEGLSRAAAALRTGADALTTVLLSPACAACDALLDEPTRGAVCAACWRGIPIIIPPICATCGQPLASWRTGSVASGLCARCRRSAPHLDILRSAALFDGSLPAIIHAFKYGARRSLARRLAGVLLERTGEVLAGADAVVPVPLHTRRLRRRGFNQSADIASHLGVPVLPTLRRVRDTPSQTDLPAGRRHRNVRDAFALQRGRDVRGLRLVLVDDVATTGATLDACGAMLKRAGAREVRAVTIARAAVRPD